ncbi:MAG: hypothetical protein IPP59_18310 [Betaproteobacteria bacterium]|nr:hypothetical protein [Candidatus Dechloromonas phosphorivorans]
MKVKDRKGVAFFDIRTPAEAILRRLAIDADALVPFVEPPELMTEWDERAMYKLEPNQDFVPELERRLKEMGLGKETTIILICPLWRPQF